MVNVDFIADACLTLQTYDLFRMIPNNLEKNLELV